MRFNLVRFRVENYIVRPQFAFISEKSIEFTMPSLFMSATASAVNHTPDMIVQSAPLTVRSWLRSPTKGPLSTVTETKLDVVIFPAASRALDVNVCEPLVAVVVFQETA